MSMKMHDLRRWSLATRLAALGLFAALALDVVLAERVLWPRASDESFQPLVLRTPPPIAVRTPDDAELVRQASNRTPFDAAGTRAPDALAMTAVPQQAPAPQPSRPRLVGTVVEGRGGFVIVDDYDLDACRQAIDDFRREHGIIARLQPVDGAAVYWRKP